MSINWMADIASMHIKFGVREATANMDADKLKQYFDFRIRFLQEELDELKNATSADDAVDALIDLCVVAIGTLDAYGVNSMEAWNRVHDANMAKEVGIKASRPNPLGLPDLIKPTGWIAPSHFDNVGLLGAIFADLHPVESQEPEVLLESEVEPSVETEVATEEIVKKPTKARKTKKV